MNELLAEINKYIIKMLPKNKQVIITELDGENIDCYEDGCDDEYGFLIKISIINNIDELDIERFNIYNT